MPLCLWHIWACTRSITARSVTLLAGEKSCLREPRRSCRALRERVPPSEGTSGVWGQRDAVDVDGVRGGGETWLGVSDVTLAVATILLQQLQVDARSIARATRNAAAVRSGCLTSSRRGGGPRSEVERAEGVGWGVEGVGRGVEQVVRGVELVVGEAELVVGGVGQIVVGSIGWIGCREWERVLVPVNSCSWGLGEVKA